MSGHHRITSCGDGGDDDGEGDGDSYDEADTGADDDVRCIIDHHYKVASLHMNLYNLCSRKVQYSQQKYTWVYILHITLASL